MRGQEDVPVPHSLFQVLLVREVRKQVVLSVSRFAGRNHFEGVDGREQAVDRYLNEFRRDQSVECIQVALRADYSLGVGVAYTCMRSCSNWKILVATKAECTEKVITSKRLMLWLTIVGDPVVSARSVTIRYKEGQAS